MVHYEDFCEGKSHDYRYFHAVSELAGFELIARRLSGQYSAFLIAPSVDEGWSWSQWGAGGRAGRSSGGGVKGQICPLRCTVWLLRRRHRWRGHTGRA